LVLNQGDDLIAGHGGDHRVLLYRQDAVEIESVSLEVILVETVRDDRILVFWDVGGMGRFYPGGDGEPMSPLLADEANRHPDED
jgi:hypothetical protein